MQNYNIDIERAVIGEILTFSELCDKIMLLCPDDFYFDLHKDILSAMFSVYKDTGAVEFALLSAEVGKEQREEIQRCIETVITSVLFDEHFKTLKEIASSRRLAEKFAKLKAEGDVTVSSLQQMIDDERERKLTTDIETSNARNLDSFVAKLNQKKGAVLTGFRTIDKILGGIRKSTVFIVGARPSTGKTTFALNIATNQLKDDGKKVMFFSLEMSSEMIYERMCAAKYMIDYEKFSRNTLTNEDAEAVRAEAEELKEHGRFLVVDDVYNIEQICNLITENRPNLAVIDFMQIISANGRFENVRSKIDYISSLLKRTAKATGCVILVLSQLSRAGKEAPTMSDLKESGGLEQDGDYIALLHRPYVLNKGDRSIAPSQTELLLDKNKFGQTGKIDLHFDLKHQLFVEPEPDDIIL